MHGDMEEQLFSELPIRPHEVIDEIVQRKKGDGNKHLNIVDNVVHACSKGVVQLLMRSRKSI